MIEFKVIKNCVLVEKIFCDKLKKINGSLQFVDIGKCFQKFEVKKMPFFMTKTNLSISEEQEKNLKFGLAQVVRKNFGYGEEYILAEFADNCKLYLRGDKNIPIAYIEVKVFGNENHIGYKDFSKDVTQVFNAILKIPPRNIYIKFEDITAFGVGGELFDEVH